MKAIKKLKLSHLSDAELGKKELNKLKGGGCCICGCVGAGATTGDASSANNSAGYVNPAGGWQSGSFS